MSGARTVAVLCDTPEADLRKLYQSINGLLVPGAPLALPAQTLAKRPASRAPSPPQDIPDYWRSYAGGKQDLKEGNLYHDAVVLFTKWAMEDFDRTGEVFPIHYTCLGLESLVVFVEQSRDTLSALPPTICMSGVPHAGSQAAPPVKGLRSTLKKWCCVMDRGACS